MLVEALAGKLKTVAIVGAAGVSITQQRGPRLENSSPLGTEKMGGWAADPEGHRMSLCQG